MSIFSTDHENANSGWLYQDLAAGSITDNGRRLSIDLVRIPDNTAAGWRSAADGRADADHRFYEVTISTNANLDTALKNLQYFFIRADREMQRRRENGDRNGPRLGLLVHLPSKPMSRLYKLQTFLSMLSYLRNQYDFLYSLKPSKGEEKVCKPLAPSNQNKSIQLGNMMPLLRVVADRSRQLSGDILLSDLLEVRAQDKLSDDDITACFDENGQLPQNWWKSLRSCCQVMLIRTFRSLTKAEYTAAIAQLPAQLGDGGDGLAWKHDAVLLRDAKHYFEISVTDDAAPEAPGGAACGILDHYLSHTAGSAEDQDRLPTLLKDLFEDSSFVNRDHMVLHYGLQALRQHILVNRGSFLVKAPAAAAARRWSCPSPTAP